MGGRHWSTGNSGSKATKVKQFGVGERPAARQLAGRGDIEEVNQACKPSQMFFY